MSYKVKGYSFILCIILISIISIIILLSINFHLTIFTPSFIPIEDSIFNDDSVIDIDITIDNLSQSLFCPIKHNKDIYKYNQMLSDIYNLQFNRNDILNCDDLNNIDNIFIFDENPYSWGIFSVWDNHFIMQFTLSFALNRTFIIYEQNKYRFLKYKNGKYLTQCQNRTGRQCFFKSPSNLCTQNQIKNLIKNYKKNKKEILIIDDKECKLMFNNKSITTFDKFIDYTLKYKIIRYHHSFTGACSLFKQKSFNRLLTESIINNRGYNKYNLTYFEFNMLILSFLLRPQNNIKQLINEIVFQSLNKYGFISSLSSISLAIRGSDKCWSHRRHGEMRCRTMKQNIDAIKQFQNKFGNHINQIIVTSEDKNIIKLYKNYSKHQLHGRDDNLIFIFNDFDVTPNSGNPVELTQGTKNETIRIKNDLFVVKDDKSYFDLFMSMLSTIKLQMNAKYVITQSRSNWLNGIWQLTNSIHCEIDVDDINDNNNDYKKHCIGFSNQGKQFKMDYYCDREDRFVVKPNISHNMLKIPPNSKKKKKGSKT